MDFELLYKRLNNEQKQAVDAIEGPVMVIAGPGTGKTEILTLRIANILNKTQVDADNILALTFTESGAMSMKKRLISIIGNDAYRVNINTFHGFCNEIIQDYPEYFENIAGFKNIDEVKQIEILKQVLDSLQLEYLTTFNNNYFFLRDIKSAIDELKKEGVSYSELRKLAEQLKHDFENNEDNYNPKTKQIKINVKPYYKTICKNIELSYIFEKYQELMAKSSYYDYSDMIVEVLNTLKKDNDLLLIIQEQYQYFLVDEYQDTNTSQNQVLELLCNFHQNPNIFIVGDPKQAIFRFQGASIHNFAYFKSLYPTAIIIDLINNYRSSQLILDSAFFLIGRDKQLKSAIDYENKKIQIYTLPNSNQEAYFVVKKIRELLSNNINANDIAVLYRNHKDSDILVDLLEKFQIPFSIKKKINIFNDLDIQKLLLIVDTIYNYGNDSFLFKCMHIDFLNINPIDIYKIVNYCNQNHINGYDFLNKDIAIDLISQDKIIFLKEKLKEWSIQANNILFLNLVDNIIKDVEFYNYLQTSHNIVDKIDKIDGFFDQIKRIAQSQPNFMLADFINYLNIIKENSIDIDRESILGDSSGVKLMTAHHAKGLEFDYVFIIGTNTNKWEGKNIHNRLNLLPQIYQVDRIEESEEKNLFFVCLTRAKKQLYITNYITDENGKILIPSSFLNDIKAEYKENFSIDLQEQYKNEHINFMAKINQNQSIKDQKLVKEIFTKNGLSVTAFNNYLECPWKYFYRNLFRLPDVQTKPLIKGDAIHLALRDFFNRYQQAGRPMKEFLIERFLYHLNKFPLSIKDFEQLQNEGKNILASYYDDYPTFHENVLTEFSIAGINIDNDIRLTGKIDKLEIFDNNHVNVIDYKTGKPKSENEIMGKTQKGDENYYNQLKFYGLLLKYYQNGKYIMDQGIIDFVEPNDNHKHIRRAFKISDQEILELEQEVKRVGNEILNLSFWDKYCDDQNCEFCQLRKMMD